MFRNWKLRFISDHVLIEDSPIFIDQSPVLDHVLMPTVEQAEGFVPVKQLFSFPSTNLITATASHVVQRHKTGQGVFGLLISLQHVNLLVVLPAVTVETFITPTKVEVILGSTNEVRCGR